MKNKEKGGTSTDVAKTEEQPVQVQLPAFDAARLTLPNNEGIAKGIFDVAMTAEATDITSDYINFSSLEDEWTKLGHKTEQGIPAVVLGTKTLKGIDKDRPDEETAAVEVVYQKWNEDGDAFVASRGVTTSAVIVSNLSALPIGAVVRIKFLGMAGKKPREYENYKVLLVSTPQVK